MQAGTIIDTMDRVYQRQSFITIAPTLRLSQGSGLQNDHAEAGPQLKVANNVPSQFHVDYRLASNGGQVESRLRRSAWSVKPACLTIQREFAMIQKAADLSRRGFVRMGSMAVSALANRRAWAAHQKERTDSAKSLFDGKTLDGWIQVENNATVLSTGSIVDPAAFLLRLAHGQDPMSMFLRNQLDSPAKETLSTYAPPDANAAALLSATVKQINQVLAGPSIFTADRFHGLTLRPETQALLQQKPHGGRLARLNKMLLEDAFPAEIAKSATTGWIVKDGVMASTGAGRGVIYTTQDFSRYRLMYSVRHVSGHPDHQAGVLFFCKRPQPDEIPLDALGGIQFQLPMGSHWDYRPGKNNSGDPFFTTVTKSPFDRHAWSQVELLVDAGKGTARMAVAQPPGSEAIELGAFSDPTPGRPGPIAWQMHNGGLFDEYKDVSIDIDPEQAILLSTKQKNS